MPELSVAKECCHWLKPPGLAKPPDGRPADAKHRANLVLAEKAFGRLLGLLPELGGASAAGQDGLSILQGERLVEFKGGLDEPVEAGNHGIVMPEEWKWVKVGRRDFVKPERGGIRSSKPMDFLFRMPRLVG